MPIPRNPNRGPGHSDLDMLHMTEQDREREAAELQNRIDHLLIIADQVADAARTSTSTAGKLEEVFLAQPKRGLKAFVSNGAGSEYVPAGRAWAVSPSSGGAIKNNTPPRLTNKSGLGLLLMESGEVAFYLNPKKPTLLSRVNDQHNPYVTPIVISECFNALTRFVQEENI